MLAGGSAHGAPFRLRTSGRSDMADVLADLTEDVNDRVEMELAAEINRENESFASDGQRQDQNQPSTDNADLEFRLFDNPSNVDPREGSLGVRQGIQLLNRHIDNMQRLCR